MKVAAPTQEDAVALLGIAGGERPKIVGQQAVVQADGWTFRAQELDDSAEEVEPSGEVGGQRDLMEALDRRIVEGLVACSGSGQPSHGAPEPDAGAVHADITALLVQGVEDEGGVGGAL